MYELSSLRNGKLVPRAAPMPDPIGSPLLLCPAYGRVYPDEAVMSAEWESGSDFKMYGCGTYCSVRDIATLMQGTSSLTLFQASPLLTVRIAGYM
jgi:hypothetical protein